MPQSLSLSFQRLFLPSASQPTNSHLPISNNNDSLSVKLMILGITIALFSSSCQTMKSSSIAVEADETATNLDIARAFLDSGRPDKSMFELRAIIEKNPNDATAQSLMGLTQLALKNPRMGVAYLETAWRLAPTAQHALNLSSAYIENRQLQDAQKTIMKGLRLNETPAYKYKERFFHNLGFIAELKGNPVIAEKAYLRALVENPTFYISRAKMAHLMELKNKFTEAKEHWELARLSCAGCFEPVARIAVYYQRTGDPKKSLVMIQEFKNIEGTNPLEVKKASALETEISKSPFKIATLPKQDSLQ